MEGGVTGVQVDASLACVEVSYWLSGMSVGVPLSNNGDPEEEAMTE